MSALAAFSLRLQEGRRGRARRCVCIHMTDLRLNQSITRKCRFSQYRFRHLNIYRWFARAIWSLQYYRCIRWTHGSCRFRPMHVHYHHVARLRRDGVSRVRVVMLDVTRWNGNACVKQVHLDVKSPVVLAYSEKWWCSFVFAWIYAHSCYSVKEYALNQHLGANWSKKLVDCNSKSIRQICRITSSPTLPEIFTTVPRYASLSVIEPNIKIITWQMIVEDNHMSTMFRCICVILDPTRDQLNQRCTFDWHECYIAMINLQ